MPKKKTPTVASATKVVKKLNGNVGVVQGKRYVHLILSYPTKEEALELLAFKNVVSLSIDPYRAGDSAGLQVLLEGWNATLQIVRLVNCKDLAKVSASVEQLSKLRELILDSCPINAKLAHAISALKGLKDIQLSHCGLTQKTTATIFAGCQRLEDVSLYEERLPINKLGFVFELKKLKCLHLN